MASANLKTCSICMYKSGDGEIIICGHKEKYGMAMRANDGCDHFEGEDEPIGVVFNRAVGDTVGGEDF